VAAARSLVCPFASPLAVRGIRQVHDEAEVAVGELWLDRSDDPWPAPESDLITHVERLVAAQMAGGDDGIVATKLVPVVDGQRGQGQRAHDRLRDGRSIGSVDRGLSGHKGVRVTVPSPKIGEPLGC
jgi:hypothetical protein